MNSTGMSASSAVPTIKCEEISSLPSVLLSGCDGDPTAGAGGGGGSYNLSVNVNLSAAVSSLLAAESACSTPRTPEILNSLIAMSNPLDQYNYEHGDKSATAGFKSGSCNDSNSSASNGSSATSPASGTPPSVQKTCSELIKAGLKLSIESKRKMSGSECSEGTGSVKRLKKEESDEEYDSSHTQMAKGEGQLTPEDEERRRRRRERNKIAATKCRLKKRERTVNLVTESEVLESQNLDLKSQLKDLDAQRRQLIEMLSVHSASCLKNNPTASPTTQYNMMRPYESPSNYPTTYEASSPYIRPESANILASSYTCITPISGESSIDTISSMEAPYITQQMIEAEYNRPDSVLSLPPAAEPNYVTTDGYLPKATNLLIIEPGQDYYEDVDYHINTQAQQCHSYTGVVTDAQTKINNGLNDGCLV